MGRLTDAQLRKGMPPGWRRHPQEPYHAIEHDSGRLRIAKAFIFKKASYTVWFKENADWTRAPGNYDDIKAAVDAAEELI